MIVNFYVRATGDHPSDHYVRGWRLFEDWPAAEGRPNKGEMVLLGDGREQRVIEVCQVGIRTFDIYLVPTNINVPPLVMPDS